MLWNVEGLEKKLNLIPEYDRFDNYDLLCFVETFAERALNIEGFRSINLFANKLNSNGARKGISIFYKNEHKFGKKIAYFEIEDFALIQVFENIIVFVGYFHPNYHCAEFSEKFEVAISHLRDFSGKPLLLLGDFNCRLDLQNKNTKTKYLLSRAEQLGLNIANDHETKTYGRPGWGSVIDLIFFNNQVILNEISVQQDKEKKHHPVTCKIHLKDIYSNLPAQVKISKKPAFKLDLDKINFLINHDYLKMSLLLDSEKIDDFYNHVLEIVEKAKYVSRKKNRKSKPWFDSECYLFRKHILSLYCVLANNNFRDYILHENFAQMQKDYKKLLKEKKLNFAKKQEERLILEAEQEAHLFLKQPVEIIDKVQNPIDMDDWINHMSKILNFEKFDKGQSLNLDALLEGYDESIKCNPISEAEVYVAIWGLKNKKAPGPDMLLNENIKVLSDFMLPMFVKFFNKCLSLGKIPKQWKCSTMKLLYKNKGRTDDCNSYRGICLSNTLCKLLDKILYRRILEKFKDVIPEQQYGFMPEKSTIEAAKKFHAKITESVQQNGEKMYAIFIDLTKAFDLSNRKIFLRKAIDQKKLSKKELSLLCEFLDLDFISINDGISSSENFVQSNGFKQGMNSSPLLFNIYIHDIIKIFENIHGVEFLFYADDMVFLSKDLETIKSVMGKFLNYAKENNLKPNYSKTKVMKFSVSGAGRPAANDELIIDGHKIEFVNCFPYLGIYFQKKIGNFSEHVEQRVSKSTTAMCMFKDLRRLSLYCATRLFELKFGPMASYGIEVVWEHLKPADFETLESAKSRYFKYVMSCSKYNKNTYVYRLCEQELFVNDLKEKFNLPETENYRQFVNEYMDKHDNRFNMQFLETPAMKNDVWKGPLFDDRHVFCRFALHGFHNLICCNSQMNQNNKISQCYEEQDSCVCTLCGQKCTQYHLNECARRAYSIKEYAINAKALELTPP